jgi:hypothetical protein
MILSKVLNGCKTKLKLIILREKSEALMASLYV